MARGVSFDPRGCAGKDVLQLSSKSAGTGSGPRRAPDDGLDHEAHVSLQSRRVLWKAHLHGWLAHHDICARHEDARRAAAQEAAGLEAVADEAQTAEGW